VRVALPLALLGRPRGNKKCSRHSDVHSAKSTARASQGTSACSVRCTSQPRHQLTATPTSHQQHYYAVGCAPVPTT